MLKASKKAVEHKNKLIEYDRNSAKRTQVIDDESDYFNSNSRWLSKDQRQKLQVKEEEMREKKFGSRLNRNNFTFDFAGRQVVSEQTETHYETYSQQVEKILSENPTERKLETSMKNLKIAETNENDILNPDINWEPPKFVIEEKAKKSKNAPLKQQDTNVKRSIKVQDKELQELKDSGMCMSMYQPWASLLVCGIKKHEGRTWYTPHRGRLWIHAGSKQPTPDSIKEVEDFYRKHYKNDKLQFPLNYPTSCLLGYVDLADCLSQDNYREKYPNGESESEFVFICENPSELVVKAQMSGQPKIFKLDTTTHNKVKKQQFYTASY